MESDVFVLISGKAGVGKSTLGDMLRKEFKSYGYPARIIPFAQKIKLLALDMGWNEIKNSKGRKLLQDLGKVGRDYDEYMWVRMVERAATPLTVTIVDDWRFPNELHFLQSRYPVVTIRVKGTTSLNGPLADDVSETALDAEADTMFDYVVANVGSIQDLYWVAEGLAEEIIDERFQVYLSSIAG